MTKHKPDKRARMLEQARGLFALSQKDSGAFKAEIENASKLLQVLMEKYHITMLEVTQAAKEQEEEQDKFTSVHSDIMFGRLKQWHWYLARGICRITYTKSYSQGTYGHSARDPKGHKRRGKKISFFGAEEAVTVATELFKTWAIIIDDMAKVATAGYVQEMTENPMVIIMMFEQEVKQFRHLKELGHEHPTIWRSSWLLGVTEGILSALREQEEKRSKEMTSALMVVEEKLELAYEKFSKDFGKAAPRTGSLHGDAYNKGRAVGKTLNLGTVRAPRVEGE